MLEGDRSLRAEIRFINNDTGRDTGLIRMSEIDLETFHKILNNALEIASDNEFLIITANKNKL